MTPPSRDNYEQPDDHSDHDELSEPTEGDRNLMLHLRRAISHDGNRVPVYLATHGASFLTPVKVERFLLYQRVRSTESGRMLAIQVQIPISTRCEQVALNLIARANHQLIRGHFTMDVNRGELAFRYEAVIVAGEPIIQQFLDAQQQVNRLLSKHLRKFQRFLFSEDGRRTRGSLLPPDLFPPRDPETQFRATEDEEGPSPEH